MSKPVPSGLIRYLTQRYPIFQLSYPEQPQSGDIYYQPDSTNKNIWVEVSYYRYYENFIIIKNRDESIEFVYNTKKRRMFIETLDYKSYDKAFYFKIFDMGIHIILDDNMTDQMLFKQFGLDMKGIIREYRIRNILKD